ncbi:hypothetical protein JAAARDRAFT_210825 [Jaapia argillacea MUCL 33604]|uniref:Nucleoporin protein Ndc1-Nup n=1 Tax=Jaapia argillacea MUCL 33604 TaxID=933084 RepID=A0A067PNE7_9AGAM|nr:hypothetical protein JAAARDRAFT_210825 [Jaapia argillacea MUCL 33604]
MSAPTTNQPPSQGAPSTPVRAITSTLAGRSPPSLPPASQQYEPAIKAVLRHRLVYNIFLSSAAFSWAWAYAWNTWSQGGLTGLGFGGCLYNLVSPFTFSVALVGWVIGVVPVVVMRKTYLTATPTPSPSPSKLLRTALSKPSAVPSLVTYGASAILLTLLHVFVAYANESTDPRLTVFVKSRKHPYYLNGRFLYLLLSQIFLACSFLVRNAMLDRFVVKFNLLPSSPSTPNQKYARYTATATLTTLTTLIFTLLSLTLYTILFGLTRTFLLPILLNIPFLRLPLRPFLGHFVRRGGWTLGLLWKNAGLVGRAWWAGVGSVAVWEVTEKLFDAYVSQPISLTPSNTPTLISGLSSTSSYFAHHAYTELRSLAQDESDGAKARRTALFADQKFTPSLWGVVSRESLLRLGKDYQAVLRRGKPAPIAPAVAPPPKKIDAKLPSTPILHTPIFKSKPQSPIKSIVDSLASEGTIAQAVTNTAEMGAAHIPELFRSVAPGSSSKPAAAAVTAAPGPSAKGSWVGSLGLRAKAVREGLYGRVGSGVMRYSPVWVVEVGERVGGWWGRDRVSRVVEGYLVNRELDVIIIDVLSHLTCASLTEDNYGVVQRDIPRILEASLSFLSAIEECQKELAGMVSVMTPEEEGKLGMKEREERGRIRGEVGKAGEVLGSVGDALKEGVARIVRTFRDKLGAFKFPPATARKLQGFVDYS